MATHSSTLAWKIPWMEGPGGLQSMGSLGVGHDWSDLVAAVAARRSNQSILKEISPGISLEGMMLKLKLQYFGYLMWRVDSFEKTLMLGGIGGKRKRGWMAGWHHWLDGCEFEWTLGDGDGQGGLVCCDSWGRKELDTTEWLNWTQIKTRLEYLY